MNFTWIKENKSYLALAILVVTFIAHLLMEEIVGVFLFGFLAIALSAHIWLGHKIMHKIIGDNFLMNLKSMRINKSYLMLGILVFGFIAHLLIGQLIGGNI